jgi:hypothetical protein
LPARNLWNLAREPSAAPTGCLAGQRVLDLFLEFEEKHGRDGVAILVARLGVLAAAFLMNWTSATGEDPLQVLDHWEFDELT